MLLLLSMSRYAAPPPSSIAPDPTSHESMWPPITTISSGFSRPRNSPMTLWLSASGSIRALIRSVTRTLSPRLIMRRIIIASSAVTLACGIFFTVESYAMFPVCGVRMPYGPALRAREATAPAFAAAIAPCRRKAPL